MGNPQSHSPDTPDGAAVRTPGGLSNDVLCTVFRELHDTVVNSINVDDVVNVLFAKFIISAAVLRELTEMTCTSVVKSQRLLAKLHTMKHPRAFVELRLAIKRENAYSWLVDAIDRRYNDITRRTTDDPDASLRMIGLIRVTDDVGQVCGVAQLLNTVFVVCWNSSVVRVFYGQPPFGRRDDIAVPGLLWPTDMTVCRNTESLFIADHDGVIYRIDLSQDDRGQQVSQWPVDGYRPWTLSAAMIQLVVTPEAGDAAYVYGDEGRLVTRVPLPDCVKATHAVESKRRTYFVCHVGRLNGDTEHDQVIEVNWEGVVIRSYGGPRGDGPGQLNIPEYMALDPVEDRLIVIDRSGRWFLIPIPDAGGLRPINDGTPFPVDCGRLQLPPYRLSYESNVCHRLVFAHVRSKVVSISAVGSRSLAESGADRLLSSTASSGRGSWRSTLRDTQQQ